MIKRGLPSVPSSVKTPAERSFLKAVKDILENLTGARGNDAIALKSDLAKLTGTTTYISGGGTYSDISEIPGYDNLVNSISSPYDNESVPPAPLGVVGSATVGTAFISWTVPNEDYIEVVEVWKQGPFTSQQVGLVRENAFLAGTAPARGGVFADPTEQGAWNYYWVRFRSLFGNVGAWHSVTAIEVQNQQSPDYLLSTLSGQITDTQLSAALETTINLGALAHQTVNEEFMLERDYAYPENEWDVSYAGAMETLPTIVPVATGADVNVENTFAVPSGSTIPYEQLVWQATESATELTFGQRIGYRLPLTELDGTRTAIIVGVRLLDNGVGARKYSANLRLHGSFLAAGATPPRTPGTLYNGVTTTPLLTDWVYLVVFVEPYSGTVSTEQRTGVYDGTGTAISTLVFNMMYEEGVPTMQLDAEVSMVGSNTTNIFRPTYEFTAPRILKGLTDFTLPDLDALFRDPEPYKDTRLVQVERGLGQVETETVLLQNEMLAARGGEVDLAARIQTVELDVSNQIGVITQDILTLDGDLQITTQKVTEQGALWHVTQDVDGYVTGFGVYNNGATSQALFRVDQFGIGSPGASNLTFVVDGSQVVMSGASIQDATVTNAKIQSLNVDKIVGDTASFVQANIGTITTGDISGLTSSFIATEAITGFVGALRVNTLQIADDAVTVPKVVYGGIKRFDSYLYPEGTKVWTTIISTSFNHGHSATVPVQFVALAHMQVRSGAAWEGRWFHPDLRVLLNGTVVTDLRGALTEWVRCPGNVPFPYPFNTQTVYDVPAGSHTVSLQVSCGRNSEFSPGSGFSEQMESYRSMLSMLAVKR